MAKILFKELLIAKKKGKEIKRLTPAEIKAKMEGRLLNIIADWKKGEKTLAKADKVMRKIWLLTSSGKVNAVFLQKCMRSIVVMDKWVRDFVAKNPNKVKLSINNFIKRLRTKNASVVTVSLGRIIPVLRNVNKGQFKPTELTKLKKIFKKPGWEFKVHESVGGIVIVNKKNPNIWRMYNFKEFLVLLKANKLDQVFDSIKAKYIKERDQKSRLKKFDLPKNQKISYIRFFPKSYDLVTSSAIQFSGILGQTLKSRYPKMHVNEPLLSNNFKVDLSKRIKKDYDKGIRVFNLDIYSHGSKKSFMMPGQPNSKDLVAMMRKFPDAKFNINTIACYGAGLGKDLYKLLKTDPKLKSRVSAFLQTKPNLVNLAAKVKVPGSRPQDYSTYYYLYFIRAIQQGKTYGEAAAEADRLSQKNMYLDPEAIINGEKFVRNEKARPNATKVV